MRKYFRLGDALPAGGQGVPGEQHKEEGREPKGNARRDSGAEIPGKRVAGVIGPRGWSGVGREVVEKQDQKTNRQGKVQQASTSQCQWAHLIDSMALF